MSWHYSRALVAAYSAANFSDGKPPEPLKSTNSEGATSWPAKMMDHSIFSRYGTMCVHLMGSRGADWWMSLLADFRASESARRAKTESTVKSPALPTPTADSGDKKPESFAKWGRDTFSWKTAQISPSEDSASYLGIWPRWGSMQNGECFRLKASALPTKENAYGSKLPTPTAHNAKEGAYPAEFTRRTPTLGAVLGGKINPEFTEWMMGLPIGWTDLRPLETAKFQQWLDSHGKH